MNERDYGAVMALFDAALAVPEDQRAAFIATSSEPEEVRQRVRAMLCVDSAGATPLDSAGAGVRMLASEMPRAAGVTGLEDRPPQLAGAYRVLRLIGEGGMGAVYEAEQASPRRLVALKVLRQGPTTRRALRRLELEAQALARLHHPGIAQVYEAGIADETAPDRAFIAMELIRGEPLTDHATGRGLGQRERLDLFLRVCDAVAHAHQRGVIHRDLKPANILVAADTGAPKVLDFGIARMADSADGSITNASLDGQIMGTLLYMSPEQAGGDPDAIDVRTDVYSLGVLLHELLTEAPLFRLEGLNLLTAIDLIRRGRAPRSCSAHPASRGDLGRIIEKSIAPERDDRYDSVGALARDVRNHLTGRPVEARRGGRAYVLSRFARRHRAPIALASLIAVALLTSWAVAVAQARRSRVLASAERAARIDATLALESARSERQRADETAETLRRNLYFSQIAVADGAIAVGDRQRAREALQATEPDLRAWEWRHLSARIQNAASSLACFSFGASSLFAERAGPGVVVAHISDGLAILADKGARVARSTTGEGLIVALGALPGRWIATATADEMITIRDLETLEVVRRWDTNTSTVRAARADPVSGDLWVIGNDRVIDRWSAHGERLASHLAPEGDTLAGALTPDGRLVAAGGSYGVVILDAATGALVGRFQTTGRVLSLAFDASGARLAAGCEDQYARVYDVASGREVFAMPLHEGRIWSIALTGDGRLLATGGTDSTIIVTEVETGRRLDRLLAHEASVTDLAFVESDRALLSIARDGHVKRWERPFAEETPPVQHGVGWAAGVFWSGREAAIVGDGVTVVNMRAQEAVGARTNEGRVANQCIRGPDGLFVVEADGVVSCWRDGAIVWSVTPAHQPADLAFHSDDLIVSTRAGTIERIDRRSGASLGALAHVGAPLQAIAATESHVAVGGVNGEVVMLLPDGRLLQVESDLGTIWRLRFSPDGRTLAGASESGGVRVWDAQTLDMIADLPGHQGASFDVVFTPDGRRVFSGGADATVRLWALPEGVELLRLVGHAGTVSALALSPDGADLASAGGEGTLRIWAGGSAPATR